MSTLERAAVAVGRRAGRARGVAHYARWAALPRSLLATPALAGLAWIVSVATEQVGERIGPAGDRAAAGDARQPPRALRRHLRAARRRARRRAERDRRLAVRDRAARARPRARRRLAASPATASCSFDPKVARDASTLLLACVFIIVIVGLSLSSGSRRRPPRQADLGDRGGAAADGLPRLGRSRTCAATSAPRGGLAADRAPQRAGRCSVLAGVGAGFVSDWFVDALAPVDPPAPHLAGVRRPRDRRDRRATPSSRASASCSPRARQADLAISVVVNSVAQIAAFLFPALVLISLATPTHADLRAAADLHRRARDHRDRRLAGHRRRRGAPLRGLGAHRHLCRPCHHHAL